MQECRRDIDKFLTLSRIHTDDSLEVIKACQELQRTRDTSTPRRSETNLNRRRSCSKREAQQRHRYSVVSLSEEWCNEAMELNSQLRNIHDMMADVKPMVLRYKWEQHCVETYHSRRRSTSAPVRSKATSRHLCRVSDFPRSMVRRLASSRVRTSGEL